MRDKRFVAEHRGGLLLQEQHRLLMLWACACVEHVLGYYGEPLNERMLQALAVGKAWSEGKATVGEARKAAVDMLALARALSNPVQIALVRATGHAVATAHMADHSMGGAIYGALALKLSRKSIDEERAWQVEQLPENLRTFVVGVMMEKASHFRGLRGISK